MKHPSHRHNLPRLNRIIGQLEGIKKMIQEERYCPDILTQLLAAQGALRNLEVEILDTHMSHCVTDALQSSNPETQTQKISEIRELLRRFNK